MQSDWDSQSSTMCVRKLMDTTYEMLHGLVCKLVIHRPNYLPMEVCKIVEGQRYSKRLNEKQITALLKVTCQRPHERQNDIQQTVRLNAYDEDEYAKEFGININNTLTSVEARILPPPWLKYHDAGKERNCLPRVGQWNMMNKKMVNGGIITNWACINFSRNIHSGLATQFCFELAHMCQIYGMQFAPEPLLPVMFGRPDQVDKALRHQYNEASKILKPQNKKKSLAIEKHFGGKV